MISRDPRLRIIALLLAPAFVGHFVQLMREDTPWTYEAGVRYLVTPGWHHALPYEACMALAAAVPIAMIGMLAFRSRGWLLAVCGTYLLHYLSWPFRIRNHMTLMLSSLVVIGVLTAIAARAGAINARTGEGPSADAADDRVVWGVALVLCITYFFAGFHKMNPRFTSADPGLSSAAMGIADFLRHGGITRAPPAWLMGSIGWLSIGIELAVPIIAWRVNRLTVPCVLVLMGFHFPMVAVMNVADYPMLASAFWPALFTRGQWEALEARLRPSRWTVTGAAVGVAAQFWFMPWWGWLTGFGVGVMALWGWAAGAMVQGLREKIAP